MSTIGEEKKLSLNSVTSSLTILKYSFSILEQVLYFYKITILAPKRALT